MMRNSGMHCTERAGDIRMLFARTSFRPPWYPDVGHDQLSKLVFSPPSPFLVLRIGPRGNRVNSGHTRKELLMYSTSWRKGTELPSHSTYPRLSSVFV